MLAIYDHFLTESISSRAWIKHNSHTAWQSWNYTCTASSYTRRALNTGSRCQNAKIAFAKLWSLQAGKIRKKIASRRSAETEFQNTIELRTTASEIVAPKPSRAAKDNSITNAATARSNLDTAITMWSAETELQSTTELRTTASEIVAPKPVLDARAKKRRFWSTFYKGFWKDYAQRRRNCSSKPDLDARAKKRRFWSPFFKSFLEGKSLAPKWRKSADKSMSQPSCSHSNTIYEIQLQKTIVLPMQPQHEATLTQPLQCDLHRQLQNTKELRATASEIVAPKPDLDAKRKKDDFEALFKRIFRRKIISAKMEKIGWQITVAAFMQPLQYDLRSPAAKDNSITNAATARSNLDAATTGGSAETELQNTTELRTTASEIVAPKPDLDAKRKKDDFEALFKRIFRRKIISAKMEKIGWQITVAAFMQPLQYDLRSPAAKDNSITNAATARSNLDAATTGWSAETELQNTTELRTTASEIVAPKPDLIFDAFFIKNLNRKWKQAKSERIQLQQVHAAITMRLATIPSETQWYYVLSSSTEAFETF